MVFYYKLTISVIIVLK